MCLDFLSSSICSVQFDVSDKNSLWASESETEHLWNCRALSRKGAISSVIGDADITHLVEFRGWAKIALSSSVIN